MVTAQPQGLFQWIAGFARLIKKGRVLKTLRVFKTRKKAFSAPEGSDSNPTT